MLYRLRRLFIVAASVVTLLLFTFVAAAASELVFLGGRSLDTSTPGTLDGEVISYTTDAGTADERIWEFTLNDANGVVNSFGDAHVGEFRIRTPKDVTDASMDAMSVTLEVKDSLLGPGYVKDLHFTLDNVSKRSSNIYDQLSIQAFNENTPVVITVSHPVTISPIISGNGTINPIVTADGPRDFIIVDIPDTITRLVFSYDNLNPSGILTADNNNYIDAIGFTPVDPTSVTMREVGSANTSPLTTSLIAAFVLTILTAGWFALNRPQDASL